MSKPPKSSVAANSIEQKQLNDLAVSEESFEQKMAFETYYKTGESRSISRLSKEVGKAVSTLELWSKRFRWQSRVAEREKAAAEYMLIQEDAKKNAEVKKNHLTLVDATISSWVQKLKNGDVKLKGVDDLQKLIKLRWFISEIPDKQVNPTHQRSESGANIDLRLRDMGREELYKFLYSTLKSIDRVVTKADANVIDHDMKTVTQVNKKSTVGGSRGNVAKTKSVPPTATSYDDDFSDIDFSEIDI